MRDVVSKVLFAMPIAVAAASAACGSDTPAVPANPTYTTDVKPILDGHCIKCHGADDMLHTMVINGYPNSPSYCYLQRYPDEGDCSNLLNADCKAGAGSSFCQSQMVSYISLTDPLTRMPPGPDAPLSDREKQVVMRWVSNGGPQ
jgi:hypothetical protein